MKGLKILFSLVVVSFVCSALQAKAVNYINATADVAGLGSREDMTSSVKKQEDGVAQRTNNFVMTPNRDLRMKMYRWSTVKDPYLVMKEKTVDPGASYTISDASTLTAGDWYYLTFRSFLDDFNSTHVELIWIVN